MIFKIFNNNTGTDIVTGEGLKGPVASGGSPLVARLGLIWEGAQ